MNRLIGNIFFKGKKIKTFLISRLTEAEVEEKVYLKKGGHLIDITKHQGMICLDPFCLGVWLNESDLSAIEAENVTIQFKKGSKLNALLKVSLIETFKTENGALLLYKIGKVKNYQLNPLHRLVFFAYLMRSQKNTSYDRRVISALYSYPRNIIIVSYRDAEYHNIFPMDIHANIAEEGLYILGLRTTNVTLDKILSSKKVVVCDTDKVDINTIYDLGKHPSTAPTSIAEMPFNTTPSEAFGFLVPDFVGSYKEIEIIYSRKMGYHMLMVGRVVNSKIIREDSPSFYHVGFLQHQGSNYSSVDAVY